MLLEKILESPLNYKEIKPVNPQGNQPWLFIGRTDAEAETPILWPLNAKSWLIGKDPDAGKDWSLEEKGATEEKMVGWHHWLNEHEFEQAPGDSKGRGSLVCCSPWSRKVRHNWATEWQQLPARVRVLRGFSLNDFQHSMRMYIYSFLNVKYLDSSSLLPLWGRHPWFMAGIIPWPPVLGWRKETGRRPPVSWRAEAPLRFPLQFLPLLQVFSCRHHLASFLLPEEVTSFWGKWAKHASLLGTQTAPFHSEDKVWISRIL